MLGVILLCLFLRPQVGQLAEGRKTDVHLVDELVDALFHQELKVPQAHGGRVAASRSDRHHDNQGAVSRTTLCHTETRPGLQSDIVSWFRRRNFVLATILASFVVTPKHILAFAEENFADGPDGLKYRDIAVGRGAAPSPNDKIVICDVPGQCGELTASDGDLSAAGSTDDDSKLFVYRAGTGVVIEGLDLAVLGEGSMPPMRVGGTRKVLIPPKLGYGDKAIKLQEGVGCEEGKDGKRGDKCDIPAASDLEFTIQLVSIEREPAVVISKTTR